MLRSDLCRRCPSVEQPGPRSGLRPLPPCAGHAVRIDHDTFALIDFFADEAGQNAHLGGQVAAALKAQAAEMIVGGWDDGVLKNFKAYAVLSAAA